MPDPSAPTPCPLCGTPLRLGDKAPCPGCLLALASYDSADDADGLQDAPEARSFGDYEITGEIAKGGMGVIYEARQISLNRKVALKLILAGEMAGKAARDMFRTEAKAAAGLQHSNIVTVYETGEHDLQLYLSMQLVTGGKNIADWARELPEPGRHVAIARAVAQVAGPWLMPTNVGCCTAI